MPQAGATTKERSRGGVNAAPGDPRGEEVAQESGTNPSEATSESGTQPDDTGEAGRGGEEDAGDPIWI